jgi:ubiquinone/menaquinone biosynthesis C-methylase UbiE
MIEAMLSSSFNAGIAMRSFSRSKASDLVGPYEKSRPLARLARPVSDVKAQTIVRVVEGNVCCSDAWEDAYRRFETPGEERKKFLRRLRVLGAHAWDRKGSIVELFCGRGNGLHALADLGFTNLEGVDLSASLLAQYTGSATCYVADCRKLPLADQSCDVVIVQGGLHHLPTLPEDLDLTLSEARRVLRPGGRFVTVEPWLTPFLTLVHGACEVRLLRRAWGKLDALATMNELEKETYEQWLSKPTLVLKIMRKYFSPALLRRAWGKLLFVGHPISSTPAEA